MGDEFSQYVDLFLKQASEQIEGIRTAVAQGDVIFLTETAHSLKSASGFIGAAKMSKICKQLQRFGESGESLGIGILTKKLEEEYPRVRR